MSINQHTRDKGAGYMARSRQALREIQRDGIPLHDQVTQPAA